MEHYEYGWKGPDGTAVFAQGWKPENDPKAVVGLVHGLGEHSGRYAQVAAAFAGAGYATASFDLRGHGKTVGQRGHFPSFEVINDDIAKLIDEAGQRYPGKPRFLYGHSLGGLLVLFYVLRRKPQLAGVIVTSAGLRSPVAEQKAMMMIARVLGTIAPTMSMPTGLDANAISRDPEVVRVYKNDPLVHGVATLKTAKDSSQVIDWVFQHAAEFSLPLLMVHGTADLICYPRGSQEFAAAVSKKCTVKLWEGLYHETHNEPEKEQVLAYNIAWMDKWLGDG